MGLRHREKGYAEPVIVTDAPAKRFKFGNGEHAYSSSYIVLPPLLLGIKSLRRLQAVLDFDRSVAVFAVDRSERCMIGWPKEPAFDSLPQQIVQPSPVEENYVEAAFVVQRVPEESHVHDPALCQSAEHLHISDDHVHVEHAPKLIPVLPNLKAPLRVARTP